MARRIIEDFRGLPKDVNAALVRTEEMPASEKLRHFKKRGLKPVTPLKKLREMAKSASVRSGVPIRISKYMPKGSPPKSHAVSVLKTRTGDVSIVMHPGLQYRTKKHIKSVIGHELDHARVYKRWKKYRKKHGYY